MPADSNRYTGGCLCGALRWEADAAPIAAGQCYCEDCRKASGSGFVPFMAFRASAIRFSGPSRCFTSKSAAGGDADRNFCPTCGGLVFGGILGQSTRFTVYAGSLDDPSAFRPTIAIMTRNRPAWAPLPAELKPFEGMPR
jgi:hypothetical protein